MGKLDKAWNSIFAGMLFRFGSWKASPDIWCSTLDVTCALLTQPCWWYRPPDIRHKVWYGKLEWCGYPKMKKVWRYVYSFWQNVRTWQTHRQTPAGIDIGVGRRPRLHSIAWQKMAQRIRILGANEYEKLPILTIFGHCKSVSPHFYTNNCGPATRSPTTNFIKMLRQIYTNKRSK